jgi:hypothetical protein
MFTLQHGWLSSGRYVIATHSDALTTLPLWFSLKADDVPDGLEVARKWLPDDDEALERYNSGQEAFAAGAINLHLRTWRRLLSKE